MFSASILLVVCLQMSNVAEPLILELLHPILAHLSWSYPPPPFFFRWPFLGVSSHSICVRDNSFCLCFCLCPSLSVSVCLCFYLHFCMFVSVWLSLSVNLSLCLSLPICFSFYLSLFVYLSLTHTHALSLSYFAYKDYFLLNQLEEIGRIFFLN